MLYNPKGRHGFSYPHDYNYMDCRWRTYSPSGGGFEPKPSIRCEHEWDGPTLWEAVSEALETLPDHASMPDHVPTYHVLAAIDRANAVKCKHCGLYRRFE